MADMVETADSAARMQAPAASDASAARLYGASWANRLIDWLDSLPGPVWLAYLVAVALSIGLELAALGLQTLPTGGLGMTDTIGLVYYGALPFAVLGLIARLDRAAGRSLRTLRPLLRLEPDEVATLHWQLTVIPARPAIAIAVLAAAITPIGYVLDPVGSGITGYTPLSVGFRWFWESLVTAVFFVLIYHTLRQLRLISRLHESIERVDLFAQAPLYALSTVTSTTAIGIVLLLVPSVFLIPSGAGASYLAITATWYGFFLVFALASFLLPLRGIHGRLAAEKARLAGEVGRRLATTIDAINRAVDADDGPAITRAQQALAALTAERDLIARIPTWPWSTGTLRAFASALFLPIVLFLIQRFLGQLLA